MANLYNKYRPDTFAEIAQPHVTNVLLAQMKQHNHVTAYQFAGPSGTGKTTCARVLAAALVCEHLGVDGEPCNKCEPCVHVREANHRDITEMNCSDHNGVDDVRDLIAGRIRIQPTRGDKRIYILDEFHMMTTQAQNALLKILEEPPPYIVFILCTTDPHKVIPAIRSRCQIHLFRRVADEATRKIVEKVVKEEHLTATDDGITSIVQSAGGSARTALQILEQVSLIDVTSENVANVLGKAPKELAIALLTAIVQSSHLKVYQLIDTAKLEGRDLSALAEDAARILMDDLARAKLMRTEVSATSLQELSTLYNAAQIMDATQMLLEIITKIRQNVPPDLIMKVSALKIIDRVAKLKN